MTTDDQLEDDVWHRLWELWKALDRPDPPDIPQDALTSEGIDHQDYVKWRLAIEDDKTRERELRADAAAADARDADLRARGMEPMPPRRSAEEVAEIERRYQEIEERNRRLREHKGEAEWLPDDDH